MKVPSLIVIIVIVLLFALYNFKPSSFGKISEHYENKPGWVLQEIKPAHYENSHGYAQPGVGASPGVALYILNSEWAPVNPINKKGNPQNVMPEFKIQPDL